MHGREVLGPGGKVLGNNALQLEKAWASDAVTAERGYKRAGPVTLGGEVGNGCRPLAAIATTAEGYRAREREREFFEFVTSNVTNPRVVTPLFHFRRKQEI